MNTDAYKNTDPYPVRPEKPKMPVKATPATVRQFADALEVYEPQMVAFRAAESAWQHKRGELESQFRRDALREAGLEGNPKADAVYRLAWEHGHASGLSEVWYWIQELATLVIDSKENAMRVIIKQVVNDLPAKRDWLDPELEKAMRKAIE